MDELNDPTEPEGWMAPIGEELVLTGHRDRVSSAAWESAASVWTGSFDKTLKCWDVARGRRGRAARAIVRRAEGDRQRRGQARGGEGRVVRRGG